MDAGAFQRYNFSHSIYFLPFYGIILAKVAKKLTIMYLANDVIQNSRKKGPEYGQEFGNYLTKAFEHMADSEEKTLSSLSRLLTIWSERGIYSETQITEFRKALGKEGSPPAKKHKNNDAKVQKEKSIKSEKEVTVEVSTLSVSNSK